ncbi:MAG: hypothetical protein LBR31_03460 [Desulfovibrio sp.]|jgi:hypothetical protein|nr:hypothetical protein [Desulfovibrio sp.]
MTMTTPASTILHMRLKNCIQTILELEPELSEQLWAPFLNNEISVLKTYLQQADDMVLNEEDVSRLEKATANFLSELKFTTQDRQQQKRVLQ